MLDPRLEHMLQEAERQSSLPPWAAKNLREAVESSPYLTEVMTKAIDSGDLKHISVSKTPNEGGHYSHEARSISINADVFLRPKPEERVDQLTGILGHETGHALMARSNEMSTYKFFYDVEQSLKEGTRYGDATVDITQMAKDYVQASRQNEALAELVSINAVSSRVKHQSPSASDGYLLRRLDPTTPCVTNGRLEPGIALDDRGIVLTGGKIQSSAVDAVGACQFDQSGVGLGVLGKSDYNDYYLSYVVSAAATVARDLEQSSTQSIPRVGLNMAELGSSPAQVEAAGIDLGGQGRAFGFADTSGGQLRPVEVRQVGRVGTGHPDIAPDAMSRASSVVLADNPAHADHNTYQQIHSWVKGTGNWNEEEGRNVTASLYKQQVDDPLIKRVDAVTGALGKDGAQNVFAVYAPFGMDKGPLFHAHVDGRQAAQEPAQQNLQQAEVLQQTQARQQTMEQTQQQTHEQGLRMSM